MLTKAITKLQDRVSARDEDGFTLIELLVVVVIIGILIAIAIPLYLNYQKGAHDKSAQSDLRGAVSTLQQCYSDNANAYPVSSDTYAAGDSQMTWTCGTSTTETANLSSGTVMTYHAYKLDGTSTCTGSDCAVFTITAYNTGGNRDSSNPYTYTSSAGGQVS